MLNNTLDKVYKKKYLDTKCIKVYLIHYAVNRTRQRIYGPAQGNSHRVYMTLNPKLRPNTVNN